VSRAGSSFGDDQEKSVAVSTKEIGTGTERFAKGTTREAVLQRWRVLPDASDLQSKLLDAGTLADVETYGRQIEHLVGSVKVPVGVAGPLRIHGRHANGEFFVPLATTEGALVASYSRGARLISHAGGCRAAVVDEALARGPVFVFATLTESVRFSEWLAEQAEALADVVAGSTRYGRLIRTSTAVEANHVYVRFEFSTADAAGQNMVTFATEALLAYIARRSPVRATDAYIEGNQAGDKKASSRALQGVRGRRVCAEVEIPAELVESKLHTTVARICDCWRIGAIGSALSGTLGMNAQYANALAALYLACGQDVACIAESAVGITRLEMVTGGALYASVTLPNLVLGTVGGGTRLPSQSACLELMGLVGAERAPALAEVTAALCLAGELSLVGAICAGEFARAHRELGRQSTSGDAP
jgi:hydroxymethylglutaryl-CoA reductase (NADPH)